MKYVTALLFTAVPIFAQVAPVWAFTGADFLQSPKEFSAGYAMGVIGYSLSVVDGQTKRLSPMQSHERDCINASNINSDTFYDAVSHYLRDNPSALTLEAFFGVLMTLQAMCPANE